MCDGDVRIWGVILAAGTSSRYGDRNKLLVPLDGEPLVVHAARTLVESPVAGVTVVVGHEAPRVRDVIADLDVAIRQNGAYERGQSTSAAEAVAAARDHNADAVLIALGDMPWVSTRTVNTLVRAYVAGKGEALAAAYNEQRGNPVLFDARFFDALADVEGDTGGRDILLGAESAALVETGDPGVVSDVDQPTDLDDIPNVENYDEQKDESSDRIIDI